MKKILRKTCIVSLLMIVSMVFTLAIVSNHIDAAEKVKLNKTKIILTVGKTAKLNLIGTKEKVKWNSSKTAVATVTSKGVVKGRKKGNCKITAKVGKKKYSCKVTVKEKKETNVAKTPKAFYIQITNNSDSEIYALHTEYYLNGAPIGGGLTGYADGSNIRKGDIMTREYEERDFPKRADLFGFQIEYYVIDKDGNEFPAGKTLNFPVSYGETYTLVLTGNYESGFEVEYKGKETLKLENKMGYKM